MINLSKDRIENIFSIYFNDEETYITDFTIKYFEEYDDVNEIGIPQDVYFEYDYQLFPLVESEIIQFCVDDPSFGLRDQYYISINI